MTLTLEDLIAQCKAENPTMTQTVNGETFVLSPKDYEQAVKDWAAMRLIQIEFEQKADAPKS